MTVFYKGEDSEELKKKKGVLADGDVISVRTTLMDGRSVTADSFPSAPIDPINDYAGTIACLDAATASDAKFGLGMIGADDANSIRLGVDHLAALLQSRSGMVASGLMTDSAEVSALQRSVQVLTAAFSAGRARLRDIETSKGGR